MREIKSTRVFKLSHAHISSDLNDHIRRGLLFRHPGP